jgi:activating signal cointegrator 1
MKAMSLTAPYSWLVAAKLKKWETRPRRTNHRGRLAIHTAKSLTPVGGEKGLLELCENPWIKEALFMLGINPLTEPRGVIVATVHVVDCYSMVENRVQLENVREHCMLITDDPAERAFGHWKVGRFAWQLDYVQKFDIPIPAKGAQGLWNWTPPVDHSLLSPAVQVDAGDIRRPIVARKPASFA